tara:strand:+ start:273 stop:1430 length:1158 start_codon:yes stop_codon:yes gene_type:complete
MSLDKALETAREILGEESFTDPRKLSAMKGARNATEPAAKKRKHSSGGEAEDVSEVPGMKGGAVSADGTTPKIAEPVAGTAKAVDDLDEFEEEEGTTLPPQRVRDMSRSAPQPKLSMPEEIQRIRRSSHYESADFGNLFDGEELSEEFKAKAAIVFDAAVDMKMEEVRSEMYEEFQEALRQQADALADKMDEYLSYVVENWMKENQVAIDSGIRSDITESFMMGLKQLFETHYINMPDEAYDVVEGLNHKVYELSARLDEAYKQNVQLKAQGTKASAEAVYESYTKDLTQTEEHRFRNLAEKIDFDTPQEFAHKLSILKENFFTQSVADGSSDSYVAQKTPLVEEFSMTEEEAVEETQPDLSRSMEAYTSALSRSAKIEKNRTNS